MLKRVLTTVLSSGYSQFVGVCTFLLTAKFYGVEGRGLYAAVTSLATFSTALVGLSIGMVLPYFVINTEGTKEQFFRQKLFTIVSLVLALSAVAALVVVALYTFQPGLRAKIPVAYLAAVGVSFPYFMWMGSNDYLFSSAGLIVEQNKLEFTNRTGFLLVSTSLMLLAHISLLGYLTLYAVFNLVQMAREIWFLMRRFDAVATIDRALAVSVIGKGMAVHAVTVASLLNTSFSVLVLTYYSKDLKDVGYFNFVCQLTAMLAILPIVVNRYLLSEITAHGLPAVWPRQKKVMLYCLIVTACGCTAAFFLIEPFCRLFKHEFLGAVSLFRLTLFVVVPSSFCILMQNQWVTSGRFKTMSAINVTVGVIGACITVLTVPRLHEFGAAATTIFTYVTLFVVNVIFYLKIDRAVAGR